MRPEGLGANRVEIAQASDPPGVRGTGLQVIQHLLHSGLGVAVGVDRRDGSGFRDRTGFWIAVERGAAAEDEGVVAMGIHGLKQAAIAIEIHIPVAQGVLLWSESPIHR